MFSEPLSLRPRSGAFLTGERRQAEEERIAIRFREGTMSDRGHTTIEPKAKSSFQERLKKGWWPGITTIEEARKATMLGVYAVVINIALTIVFLAIMPEYFGVDAIVFVVIQLAIYAVIGFFIWRNSRIAAVAGFVLFAIDKILQVGSGQLGAGAIIVIIAIGLMYISAVRGTFARHKMMQAHGPVN
jgi:hypothetical protein